MKNTLVFSFLAMVFTGISCKGQTKTIQQTDSSKSKGSISLYSPTSSVRRIIQDKQGKIWLASNEGIITYDGKTFTNITGNLSPDRFFDVLQDRNDNFWFANYGSGAYYYNGKTLKHFTKMEGLVSNSISSIFEDKAGNIWFGANGGASLYDGKSFRNFLMKGNTVIEESSGKSNSILASGTNGAGPIFEDKNGNVWFGTNGSTFIYDGKTFNVVSDKLGRTITNVWSIIEDTKGNLWLGGDGLWLYEGNTFINFSEQNIRFLCEDKSGNIWGSGGNDGKWVLYRFDEMALSKKKPTVIEIKESLNLFGVFEANDGMIWFGSYDGVYRYDGKTITDFKSKED